MTVSSRRGQPSGSMGGMTENPPAAVGMPPVVDPSAPAGETIAGAGPGQRSSSPGSSVVTLVGRTIDRLAENKVLSLTVYAGFVFTKVLAASGWRMSTALAVLDAGSLPMVVAGATLSALPPVSLILLSVAVFCWVGRRWDGKWSDPMRKPAGVRADATHVLVRNRVFFLWVGGLAVVVFAIESWTVAVVVLGCAALAGLLDRCTMTRRSNAALFALVVSVLLYAQVVSSVWLPHEAVVYGPARTVTVGYVVGDGNGDLTVLQSRTRLLLRVPMTSVHERYQCLARATGLGGLPISHYSFLLLIVHESVPRHCPSDTPSR